MSENKYPTAASLNQYAKHYFNDFRPSDFICMYLGCDDHCIGSHTLSKQSQLHPLSHNSNNADQVFTCKPYLAKAIHGTSNDISSFCSIEEVSIKKASKYPLFCKKHDEIFLGIDNPNKDITVYDLIVLRMRTIAGAIWRKNRAKLLYSDVKFLEETILIDIYEYNKKIKRNLNNQIKQKIIEIINDNKKYFDAYVEKEKREIQIMQEEFEKICLFHQKIYSKKYFIPYLSTLEDGIEYQIYTLPENVDPPFLLSSAYMDTKSPSPTVMTLDTIRYKNRWHYLQGYSLIQNKTPYPILKNFEIERSLYQENPKETVDFLFTNFILDHENVFISKKWMHELPERDVDKIKNLWLFAKRGELNFYSEDQIFTFLQKNMLHMNFSVNMSSMKFLPKNQRVSNALILIMKKIGNISDIINKIYKKIL